MIKSKPRPFQLLLLIALSAILAGCSSLLSGEDSPDRGFVEIQPDHQTCELDADCVLVYVDCSWCDCGTPINKDYQDLYLELFEETCRDYAGPVCEVYCPEVSLSCQQGICKAEPVD